MQLDVLRKLPKDLTEPTFCGALVSLVCTLIMFLLGVSEIKTYLNPEVSSQVVFQTTHTSDTVRLNIDIEFPYMPCDILGLDVEDTLGKHVGDYYGEMHKIRLAADGTELGIESWSDKNSNR